MLNPTAGLMLRQPRPCCALLLPAPILPSPLKQAAGESRNKEVADINNELVLAPTRAIDLLII